jgi:ankyrin repeat protein
MTASRSITHAKRATPPSSTSSSMPVHVPAPAELRRAIDFDDVTALEKLLQHSEPELIAVPMNSHGVLQHAVIRSASTELVRCLLRNGAETGAPGAGGIDAIELAIALDEKPALAAFAQQEALPEPTPKLALLQACARGDRVLAGRLHTQHPELAAELQQIDPVHWLIELAKRGSQSGIEALLDVGFPPDLADHEGTTALHHAAWHGWDGATQALLGNGANPELRDLLYSGTPLGWCVHGAAFGEKESRSYTGVAELLLAAGCPVAPEERAWLLETAPPALRELLAPRIG